MAGMRRPILRRIIALLVGFVAVGCSPNVTLPSHASTTAQPTQAIIDDPFLASGQVVYAKYCAHCHGANGEGQSPDSAQRTADLGYKLVPAHDASGHTWQHPDDLLRQVIREGVQNPLNLYWMAPYEEVLSAEEIEAVIAYMKLWWTDEQRGAQRAVTERWERSRSPGS